MRKITPSRALLWLSAALLSLSPAWSPAAAQAIVTESFGGYIASRPAASGAYGGTDYLPLVRGGATYKASGPALFTGLGLGTAATHATGDFFAVANNLSDGVAATMRSNLGLGSFALLNSLACAGLSDDGTACPANTGTSGHTLGFLDGDNVHSGTETFGPVIGAIGNAGAVVSGTTYTFVAGDCGKTVVFTSGSAVTATIPAAIVPAATVCAFAVLQAGTAKVSVDGSAVAAATLISESGFTGTSGTAGNMIGLTLLTVSAQTRAYLTGPGS